MGKATKEELFEGFRRVCEGLGNPLLVGITILLTGLFLRIAFGGGGWLLIILGVVTIVGIAIIVCYRIFLEIFFE